MGENMCKYKKYLKYFGVCLLISLCIGFIFCFSSIASSGNKGFSIKIAVEDVKEKLDKMLERLQSLKEASGLDKYCKEYMRKDRDWLAYLYTKGFLTYSEYQNYVESFSFYYSLTATKFVPAKILTLTGDKEINASTSQEDLDFYFVEYVARKSMEDMYNSMSDELKNKDTNIFVDDDMWYLCPYGCRSNKRKVDAYPCKHVTDNSPFWSKMNMTNLYLADNLKLSKEELEKRGYKEHEVIFRRDCSAYITYVLGNLGASWIWKIEPSELTVINTTEIGNFKDRIENSPNFIWLKYNPDELQPGDIVVRSGHTEMFMGWYDRETYDVYQYAWGETEDVEGILDKSTGTVDYRRRHIRDPKHYSLTGGLTYTMIIRYVGNK